MHCSGCSSAGHTSLRNWLSSFTDNQWLLVAFFIAIFGGIYSVINLPLSYYSGFVLPHRFGQSNQTFRDWVIDQLKGLAIGRPLACSCSSCSISPCVSPATCGGCGRQAGC
jgi:hypothetical protein